jgi:3-oxoacyl-[acyl-carrier protein] reductase
MSKGLMERMGEAALGETVLNRFGKPEDISAAALFLASNKMASFITGTYLNVDGGLYL